jgi:hypothetical protein
LGGGFVGGGVWVGGQLMIERTSESINEL